MCPGTVMTSSETQLSSGSLVCRKYEEIYPPDVGEFAYITDDTYTKKQILRMEQLVLKVLNFDLALPSQFLFVTMLSEAAGSDHKVACLAQVSDFDDLESPMKAINNVYFLAFSI